MEKNCSILIQDVNFDPLQATRVFKVFLYQPFWCRRQQEHFSRHPQQGSIPLLALHPA